jgi:metal-responsive CopG/Arc/MetJ family transcriptional regulator
MSRVFSFSADKQFADDLDRLIIESGYKNRSMFLRDATVHFSEAIRRGDLHAMDGDDNIEGTMVIYYQHGVENKLMELRHAHSITVNSYHHNCLAESHTCVDTMQLNGKVGMIRKIVDSLRSTQDIDRVEFIAAPMRSTGCC